MSEMSDFEQLPVNSEAEGMLHDLEWYQVLVDMGEAPGALPGDAVLQEMMATLQTNPDGFSRWQAAWQPELVSMFGDDYASVDSVSIE